MASVRKEILIDAPPWDVWEALRDYGAVHERLVPGFVIGTQLDGDARIVTFFNGATARELLVDLDDEARRLVWSVVENPVYTHHNASVQAFPDGDEGTRLVWIADFLPNHVAGRAAELMDLAAAAMKKALDRQGGGRSSRSPLP
jgi:hypothetical protein